MLESLFIIALIMLGFVLNRQLINIKAELLADLKAEIDSCNGYNCDYFMEF
jgi:hypothetical protein